MQQQLGVLDQARQRPPSLGGDGGLILPLLIRKLRRNSKEIMKGNRELVAVCIIAIVAVLSVSLFVLLALYSPSHQCSKTEELRVTIVTFSSRPGKVNFTLVNFGTVPITIVNVFASGMGISVPSSVNVTKNNAVPPRRLSFTPFQPHGRLSGRYLPARADKSIHFEI